MIGGGERCRRNDQHEMFRELLQAHLATAAGVSDGFAVEIRAGDEDSGDAPARCRRDDGAGRGEGVRAEQQRRDVDAVDGAHQRQRRDALQERRLQGLEEQPSRRQRAAHRESLALAQNRLPGLRDRGIPPLDPRLHPAGPVSDLVIGIILALQILLCPRDRIYQRPSASSATS